MSIYLDVASDIPFESMESIYIRITFIGIVFIHSLTYMSSYWSTKMKSFIRFTSGGIYIFNKIKGSNLSRVN